MLQLTSIHLHMYVTDVQQASIHKMKEKTSAYSHTVSIVRHIVNRKWFSQWHIAI